MVEFTLTGSSLGSKAVTVQPQASAHLPKKDTRNVSLSTAPKFVLDPSFKDLKDQLDTEIETVSRASTASSQGSRNSGNGRAATRASGTGESLVEATKSPRPSSKALGVPSSGEASKEPKRMRRASTWSPEVENAFRIQQVGWRHIGEYLGVYGQPDTWETGLIKCTRVKETGYYVYWRPDRECEDRYLNQVKLFEF